MLPQEGQERLGLFVCLARPVCKVADPVHQDRQAVRNGPASPVGKVPGDLCDHWGHLLHGLRDLRHTVHKGLIHGVRRRQQGHLHLAADPLDRAVQVVVLDLVDLLQGALGIVGGLGRAGHGLHGLRPQVLPHGAEQGHAQGVPLHLVVNGHKGVDHVKKCFVGPLASGGKGGHDVLRVVPQGRERLHRAVAPVNGPDRKLLDGVAHLVQVPGGSVRPRLENVKHSIRVKAQFCKLGGILVDGVDQFPGVVQAVLCAGRDQAESLLCGGTEVLSDGLRRPGAFRHVVLESVPQGQGALGGRRQSVLVQVGHVPVDHGHRVAHVGHAVPVVGRVHVLHNVPQALQFLPGRAGGGGHLVGGRLPFSTQVGQVLGGGDGPGPHRRQSRRHGGGYFVGRLLDGLQLLVGRLGTGPQGFIYLSGDFYGQFHDLAFCQFQAPPLPCRSDRPAAGPGSSPHRYAVGEIGQHTLF